MLRARRGRAAAVLQGNGLVERGAPRHLAEDTIVVPLVAVWAPLSTSGEVPAGGPARSLALRGEGDTPLGLARMGVAVTQPKPTFIY